MQDSYDEYYLEKKNSLGWVAIGAYSTEEEAKALLDDIRSKELPFARATFRIYKLSHRNSNVKDYPGNLDPLSSNPDRDFDSSQLQTFDYRRPWS